jgi:hypothetical protein
MAKFLSWVWPPNKQLKALAAAFAAFVASYIGFKFGATVEVEAVTAAWSAVGVSFVAWLGTLFAPGNKT